MNSIGYDPMRMVRARIKKEDAAYKESRLSICAARI